MHLNKYNLKEVKGLDKNYACFVNQTRFTEKYQPELQIVFFLKLC